MSFILSDLIPRLRLKVDLPTNGRVDLSTDGTQFNILLGQFPIISGSETVFLSHQTFTTGYQQLVYPYTLNPSPVSSGLHITYSLDYDRGELDFFQGSGTLINSTGLLPFAPWNASTLTAKYQYVKYSDSVLEQYLGFAVAEVEMPLQLGMYISGIRNSITYTPPPSGSVIGEDYVAEKTDNPYETTTKIVMADDLDILQELIATRAFIDVITRERRVGAGSAIKIVDGDTQIDTSVNQRYLSEFSKDIKLEYDDKIKWIIYNMSNGVSLRQLNENRSDSMGSYFTIMNSGPWT